MKNKSYTLVLASLTFCFCRILPMFCMPVLFKEIGTDLNLDLIQIGTIWGMMPFGSLIATPIGGILSDRFGIRRTVIIFSVLTALAGFARGFSNGFFMLAITSLMLGMLSATLMPAVTMAVGLTSPRNKQSFNQGILTASAGIAGVVGAMISATVLSPLLGGWRNVLLLYSSIALFVAMLWFFTMSEFKPENTVNQSKIPSIGQSLLHALSAKTIWLVGLVGIAYFGCMQGITGYLVLYLLGNGWTTATSNGIIAAGSAAGAIGAIPLTLLSDRIGSRKIILGAGILLSMIYALILFIFTNEILWLFAIAAFLFFNAVPALMTTIALESKEIEREYLGTAVSVQIAITQAGMIFAPPVGNSLAGINAGLPFIFWAILALCGFVLLLFLKETGWRGKRTQ